MSRTEFVTEGAVIKVHPDLEPGWLNAELTSSQIESRAQNVLARINRHVDGVSAANIELIRSAQCEHCGAKWTEDDADYNGGCCEADQLAYDNLEKALP